LIDYHTPYFSTGVFQLSGVLFVCQVDEYELSKTQYFSPLFVKY